MNIEKAQIKTLIANDLGASVEDRLEGSVKTAHELAGAAAALKQAAKKVTTDLAARADNDDSFRDGMEAAEVRGLVKKYLGRVGEYLSHLSDVEQQKAITQGGRSDGLREAMEIIKKVRDEEQKKILNLMKMVDSLGPDGEKQAPDEPAKNVPRTAAEAARMANGSLVERRAEAAKAKTKRATNKKATTKKVRTRKASGK